ncbi:MAG: NAD(P)-dependent alcohol dehydrogenase [Pseudomonadota bacterium]
MKAVVYDRYGGADRLKLSTIAASEPRAGELRVRVSACAVNLSDWEYLTGSPFYTRLIGGLFRPRVPVLGSDIVGVVDQLGAGVSGFEVGQRIMGDFVMSRRGFAEYACVPAEAAAVAPDALTDDIAACLPQAGGIAVSGTENLRKGMRLLINGAGGGSGTMALQLAKASGAHVTAVDNETKTDWLKSLGADDVIDYRKTDFADSGERWDRILDMVATRGPGTVAKVLNPGGTYQAVGGSVPVLLALLAGGWLRRKSYSIGVLAVQSGRELTERVARLAVEGRLNPHVEDVVPLSAVPEMLARTGQGMVRGKIVVRP